MYFTLVYVGGNIFGGGNSGGPFSAGGGQTVGQAGFGAPPSFQSSKPGSGNFLINITTWCII